ARSQPAHHCLSALLRPGRTRGDDGPAHLDARGIVTRDACSRAVVGVTLSINRSMAMVVMAFVHETMGKRVCGVTSRPRPTSRRPNPCDKTTAPPCTMVIE